MLPVLYCRVYCAHYTDIHHPLITLHWPRCQICQFQYKCISLILLMIRGQDKMINYFSKYLGRGGWSSWEASPSSTQSAAANSGMMRELEPGTMQQENIPGFFLIHGHLYYLLFVYFCKFSFRKYFECCLCLLRPCCACSGLRCSVLRGAGCVVTTW